MSIIGVDGGVNETTIINVGEVVFIHEKAKRNIWKMGTIVKLLDNTNRFNGEDENREFVGVGFWDFILLCYEDL